MGTTSPTQRLMVQESWKARAKHKKNTGTRRRGVGRRKLDSRLSHPNFGRLQLFPGNFRQGALLAHHRLPWHPKMPARASPGKRSQPGRLDTTGQRQQMPPVDWQHVAQRAAAARPRARQKQRRWKRTHIRFGTSPSTTVLQRYTSMSAIVWVAVEQALWLGLKGMAFSLWPGRHACKSTATPRTRMTARERDQSCMPRHHSVSRCSAGRSSIFRSRSR